MAYTYLETAEAAMRFINTRKRQGSKGIYFTLEDVQAGPKQYYDEICLYAGASGVLCYLLGLYNATEKAEYLSEAEEIAEYLQYRWENRQELKRNFSKYAFSSGWSGAGFALLNLYQATGKEEYADTVRSILDQAVSDVRLEAAQDENESTFVLWSTFQGIVGNAGTILFFLKAAKVLKEDRFREFAVEAGTAFLNQGRDMGDGKIVYQGVDPVYFGAAKNYVDPNYPMGTAGISYMLLRLYEESQDERFLKAVQSVTEYMDSVAVKISPAGKLLPHGLPDRGNLFYLGYCHGPAGTNRFYYKLYEMTKESKYLEAIHQLTRGLESMGAPAKRSEGYWNVENICCGTAGILNMYAGLWAGLKEEHYLEKAEECGKILLEDAVYEETEDGLTAKWTFALNRIAPTELCSPIGFLDGAAGIGAMLLQLHSIEQGNFHALRAVDDPFPEKA
ncbi:MAG: lanthionine synthetase LanC family protein [Eubacteriales bacterium]|nr:lanthionine synthetase LanC family protein [Eubacteriales bacterium]